MLFAICREKRAVAAHRMVEAVTARLVHHTEGGLCADEEPDHRRVAVFTADEVARSIDGVDHPDAPANESLAVVGGLFAEYGILWKRKPQSFDDQRGRASVRLSNGFIPVFAIDG